MNLRFEDYFLLQDKGTEFPINKLGFKEIRSYWQQNFLFHIFAVHAHGLIFVRLEFC